VPFDQAKQLLARYDASDPAAKADPGLKTAANSVRACLAAAGLSLIHI